MRQVIAMAGICVGLAWLGLGLWLVWLGTDGASPTRSYVGLLLCAIGIPIYGIGTEMIGRLRAGKEPAVPAAARAPRGSKWVLVSLAISGSLVLGGALVYLWGPGRTNDGEAQRYRTLFATGPGVYGFTEVVIEDIASDDGKTVHLKGEEAEAFVENWAFTGHSPMLAGLCHEPAFRIEFRARESGDEEESLSIDSFCARCQNFPVHVDGERFYQGIDLESARGARILATLEAHFPHLFPDEESEGDDR